MSFNQGDPCTVTEGTRVFQGSVVKVARKYLTVIASGRTFEFDKNTHAHRGEHGGYIPHLLTPAEHEHELAWEALKKAARDLPFGRPRTVDVAQLRAATEALRACQPSRGAL